MNFKNGAKIVIIRKKINNMRSRIFRTILTLLAPVVIDYVIKKFTGKKTAQKTNNQIPPPTEF